MAYEGFASVYDKLMHDVDYPGLADYAEEIFKGNGMKPSLLLDLGCGTGTLTLELSKRGYDMIGLDLSADMLNRARQKAAAEGEDILFLQQDMTEFELYGTVDAILCFMDSINYITSKRDLRKLLKLVKNYLNPGGIFLFDVNTAYKFREILADNVFYEVGEEITFIWQNFYDRKKLTCDFELTFFVKEGEVYKRYDEAHREKCYKTEELTALIEDAGLRMRGVYHDRSFRKPHKKSERIFFAVGKE